MLPLDLHVLGLPLAFILSQDQTLHSIKNLNIFQSLALLNVEIDLKKLVLQSFLNSMSKILIQENRNPIFAFRKLLGTDYKVMSKKLNHQILFDNFYFFVRTLCDLFQNHGCKSRHNFDISKFFRQKISIIFHHKNDCDPQLFVNSQFSTNKNFE